jgi:type IV secretion system protein VirD4
MAETSKRKVGRPKTKIPNIMQLSSSFIITDPKGELCREFLEHHGYEVKVLNLLDMKKR